MTSLQTAVRTGSPTLNLVLATWVSAINFWAWNLIGPLSPNYADKMALSSMAASIMVAMPILVGSLGRIVSGALTDRIGGRTMFIAVSLASIVPVVAVGIAGSIESYPLMLVSAFLLGIPGTIFAVGIPFANSWYVPARRGFATGVFGAGMVGTAVSAFFTPRFVRWFGLLPTHLIVAAALAVTAVLCILFMRNSPDFTPNTDPVLPKLRAAMKLGVTWEMSFLYAVVAGLAPDRWYYYRFRAGSAISPIGRTRTSPPPNSPTERLRFAFASCQSWSSGYYTAYEHLSAEDLDLVVHLGDYIYESSWVLARRGAHMPPQLAGEAVDLAGYRLRYAQAKGEAPLQAAHAAFPWLVTLDDHELDNNWAGDSPGLGLDVYRIPPLFRRRKAAAFQAMYEHQPMRLAQLPSGPSMHLHRRYRFGDLAEFTMIDTRQYRTPQACGDGSAVIGCADRFDTDRTLLGAAQRDWLVDGFATSTARWQVLGNQVAMAQSDYDPGPDLLLGTDAWDGYVADRNTVLAAAADHAVDNLVVITGDRHENYVADLRRDYADPESPVVATEFTGTSISTGSDGADLTDAGRALLAGNPDLKFYNRQRGYVRVDLDHRQWRNDFRVVPYVSRPGAPISTRAIFVVENAVPGATPA
ncbi:MFS transporter [Nocardia salmonicida]|uniref:MFS transporter n=1 Tax=Nocardia salmonicida TaxID=53431 RepID=UPI00364B6BAF